MEVLIINGPNLNLLGKREPEIYGSESFESYFEKTLKKLFPEITFHYFQSNVEGELINEIHQKGFSVDGIIINAGAYTHTSIAIADAIAAIKSPAIEVHLSNIFAREDYRHISYLGKHCKGSISGLGLKGYELAVRALMK